MTSDPENRSSLRATVIAVGICALLALALVLISYLMEGRSRADRTATELVLPVGLLWMGSLCMGLVMFQLRRPISGGILLLVFITLGIIANDPINSAWARSVEWPEPAPIVLDENQESADVTKPFRAAVVLGGDQRLTPLGTPEISRDGERIISAAQLWHAGAIESIICTGADPTGRTKPSEISAAILESLAVPSDVIYTLKGENTLGEMKNVASFLKDPPDSFPKQGKLMLITSAFHMARALRLAEGQGLDFEPHACAYRGRSVAIDGPYKLIPKADALKLFGVLLKERLAALVGR